ncbi:MAG: hypothetical protein U5K30_01280 [Acidimicrobiales bacterium]|nr:hypothetical protein [Acidimicrobiales bacterium]
MRILRLVDDDGRFAIDLHPSITVLRDLTDRQRDAIVDAFEAAAAGQVSRLRGSIEAHGVVLDVDDQALGLLELDDSQVDPRVTASDLPGSASAGVARQVRRAERRLETLERPRRDHGVEPAASQEREQATIEELEARLVLHRQYDPEPVRALVDQIRLGHATGEMVPSTEALHLADRLDELGRRLESATTAEPPEAGALEAAEVRVDAARRRMAELERGAADDESAAEIAALEQAHAAVEKARDGLDSRFSRGRAQVRLDDAIAEEQAILDRLRLASYTDYLTRGGSARPVEVESAELRDARRELADAEADAEALRRAVDDALELAALAEEERMTIDRAQALLGTSDAVGEQLVTDLANLRVPADDGPVSELIAALENVGLPVRGLGLSSHEIETMAADWLTEHAHVEAGIVASLDRLRAESDQDRAGEPEARPDGRASDLDDAPPVDEIEWYLLARLAAQRNVSSAGSVPLLVDGALDHVTDDALQHLLDRLEHMAGLVQIVHLSDDPRIAAWADDLPVDRAAVVRPVPPVSA